MTYRNNESGQRGRTNRELRIFAVMLLAAGAILSGGSPLAADMIGFSVRLRGHGKKHGGNKFSTINITNGAHSFLDGINADVKGLSFDPTDQLLYGLDSDSDDLITIDPNNGSFTIVGDTGLDLNSTGLAIDSTGNLFAVDTSGGDSALYAIDTSNGNATLLGNTGVNGIDSIAFFQSQLYGISASSRSLYAINANNGQADLAMSLDNVLASGTPTGLGTNAAGNLYGIAGDSGDIFQIDPINNLATLAGDTLKGYESFAFTPPALIPAVVPEPSSLALLVVGFVSLAGAGWQRKRRKSATS